MPQAAFVPIATGLGFTGATAIAVAQFLQVFVINFSLGALEFRDEAGELWIAIDE